MSECGSCGAHSPSTSKFCGQCGTRLTPDSRAAEYKQVTLLFADVVRSMDLAATLDMERLRDIMTEVVERSAAVACRYGGTVEYHGDGVMAIFGAPTALEDHAFRACVAALEIQAAIDDLAGAVHQRDQVTLQVRVGLNSGQVIAGEIGTGSLGYRATGGQVGLAQRMESAAPPGGVMLSESTARLVERTTSLADPEWVRIKGFDEPVRARRLLAVHPRDTVLGRTEAGFVGRQQEMAILDGILQRAEERKGVVAHVIGPPGIGKSRVAREVAAIAHDRQLDVFWTFCESHACDVPFHAVTRLLRAATGVTDLADDAARAKVRASMPGFDPADLVLLDDFLGIADPDVVVPQITPDSRRHKLTALINTASLVRTQPALYIIEDVHWIDGASESMLVELLKVIPHTASMVLVTYRPEYRGALTGSDGVETIPLAPLNDSDVSALIGQLVGSHDSVSELGARIVGRAAGNPFFAEEMVRELVQRGVLDGEQGSYVCHADIAEVSVPVTVHAAIEARIDRQTAAAKRTLHAASVIGARFEAELVAALDVEPMFDELIHAELIDQVRSAPDAVYAFRHPLIRAVAYESQLRADRAERHRRLAAAIEMRTPLSAKDNAALIAEHLEAAGDLRAAYGWHMRAGAWLTNRDLVAARVSWERAVNIADRLPADDRDQLSLRIAPRTMLCATDIQARAAQKSRARFAELEQLCLAAGDSTSLAIGMTAVATEACYAGRAHEAAQLSSRQMTLLASLDDPAPVMGLAAIAFCNWLGVMDFNEIARWSQTIVDLAAGDPAKGAGYGVGSPLAIALAWRGTSRWCLSRPGWRDDLHDAVAMARLTNPETLSGAIAWTYGLAMQYGVLKADDDLLRAAREAVQMARSASNDRAMGLAGYTLAVALLSQDDEEDRRQGAELMAQIRDIWARRQIFFLLPVTDVWGARETARLGDLDAAIGAMQHAVGELRGGYPFYSVWVIGVLVETLLKRGSESDLAEAQDLVSELTALGKEHDSAMVEIIELRLQAQLARARGDESAHRLAVRYRDAAESLGFDGHIAWSREIVGRF